MDGGWEKHVNCNLKKQGSWEEGANHRGGMESRKPFQVKGTVYAKSLRQKEVASTGGLVGLGSSRDQNTHSLGWRQGENSQLDSKVPEQH